MFRLPKELQIRIYEFDNTYHHIFQNCLQDIQYRLQIDSSIFYKSINIGNNKKNSIEIFTFRGVKKQTYTPVKRKEKINDYLFNKLLIDFYMNDITHLAFNGLYSWWNRMRKCIKPIRQQNSRTVPF